MRIAAQIYNLALGELRRATCLVQADFLALDFTRVAGHQTGLAQRALQRLVVFDEGAGDAESDSAGLTRIAATFHGDEDVELVAELGQLERLTHNHARGLA